MFMHVDRHQIQGAPWLILVLQQVRTQVYSEISLQIIRHSRETLTELHTHLQELKEDHKRKSQAHSLDQRCVGVRNRLDSHDLAIRSQTDKNMKLTGTLRDKTRFLENSTVVKKF